MQYHTHIIFGMCGFEALDVALAKLDLSFFDFSNPLYIGVFALGVLFPDIDEPRSLIGRRAPLLSMPLSNIVKHRGATHTAAFIVLISTLIFLALYYLGVEGSFYLAFAFAFGNFMHTLGDMHTKSGVSLLSPFFKKPLYLLPRSLRIVTGSPIEQTLFVAYGALFVYLSQLNNSSYGGAMDVVNSALSAGFKILNSF